MFGNIISARKSILCKSYDFHGLNLGGKKLSTLSGRLPPYFCYKLSASMIFNKSWAQLPLLIVSFSPMCAGMKPQMTFAAFAKIQLTLTTRNAWPRNLYYYFSLLVKWNNYATGNSYMGTS